MKCIGGMCDGQLADVHAGYRTHDYVRVPAKITFELNSFEEDLLAFKEGRTPEHFSIPYYEYKICVLSMSNPRRDLHYLCPVKWDEWEAIIYLFRSHDAA